ncbi:MAG: hypothetical protein EOP42_15775 [Sphingobacteriaceae bacterium]|nr:MAG: hypothetical protein EOP42_15775 [Sphingobacteriaceae bacterium]
MLPHQLKIFFWYGLFLLTACNQPQTKSDQTKNAADTVFSTTISAEEKSVAEKPVAAAALITPAKSIGKISLKESADSVYKDLGKPDSGDAAMGKSLSTWYSDHDPKGYQTQIFCTRNMGNADENVSRVKQIRVTSPYFKTKEEIGVGATLMQIQSRFKVIKTASYADKKPPYQIYDDQKGIAFEILNGKCRAVIVYLPGDRGGITYLSF